MISTYVFWIHQEEEQGKFDWSGQKSLSDFLKLCKDVGLLAIVRMGPWDHGEVRNGGFPDWVLHDGTRTMREEQRMTDPSFLSLVEPFFQETAARMKGLLWKDGGPVIGVQMDNESSGLPYLFALKKMAQKDGVDVPLYTMTGWKQCGYSHRRTSSALRRLLNRLLGRHAGNVSQGLRLFGRPR